MASSPHSCLYIAHRSACLWMGVSFLSQSRLSTIDHLNSSSVCVHRARYFFAVQRTPIFLPWGDHTLRRCISIFSPPHLRLRVSRDTACFRCNVPFRNSVHGRMHMDNRSLLPTPETNDQRYCCKPEVKLVICHIDMEEAKNISVHEISQ